MSPTVTVTTTENGILVAICGEVTGRAGCIRPGIEAAMRGLGPGSEVVVDLAHCPGLGVDGVGLLRAVYALLPPFSDLEIRAGRLVAPLLRNLFCRAARDKFGAVICAVDGSVVRPIEPERIVTVG
jgi:hypothetical protein